MPKKISDAFGFDFLPNFNLEDPSFQFELGQLAARGQRHLEAVPSPEFAPGSRVVRRATRNVGVYTGTRRDRSSAASKLQAENAFINMITGEGQTRRPGAVQPGQLLPTRKTAGGRPNTEKLSGLGASFFGGKRKKSKAWKILSGLFAPTEGFGKSQVFLPGFRAASTKVRAAVSRIGFAIAGRELWSTVGRTSLLAYTVGVVGGTIDRFYESELDGIVEGKGVKGFFHHDNIDSGLTRVKKGLGGVVYNTGNALMAIGSLIPEIALRAGEVVIGGSIFNEWSNETALKYAVANSEIRQYWGGKKMPWLQAEADAQTRDGHIAFAGAKARQQAVDDVDKWARRNATDFYMMGLGTYDQITSSITGSPIVNDYLKTVESHATRAAIFKLRQWGDRG